MSTCDDALIGEAARVIAEHGFLYQDIGPIHYLCHCAEYFLDRERWSTHVARAVLDAVADELRAEVDRLAEEKAAAYHESACSYKAERDDLRAAVVLLISANDIRLGSAASYTGIGSAALRALVSNPDAARRASLAQVWDEGAAAGVRYGMQSVGVPLGANPYREDA